MVLWPRWPLGTSRSVTKTIYRTLQLMLQYSIHNWCKHVLPPESVTWENMALFSYSLHSQNLTGSSGQARSVSLPEEFCSTLISFPIILTVWLQKTNNNNNQKQKTPQTLVWAQKKGTVLVLKQAARLPGLNSITFVKQLLAEIKEVVHYNTSLSKKTEQDKKNKDA